MLPSANIATLMVDSPLSCAPKGLIKFLYMDKITQVLAIPAAALLPVFTLNASPSWLFLVYSQFNASVSPPPGVITYNAGTSSVSRDACNMYIVGRVHNSRHATFSASGVGVREGQLEISHSLTVGGDRLLVCCGCIAKL